MPCICLSCIEEWAKQTKPENHGEAAAEKQKEEKLECLLCQKEVDIPENGLSALPRNLFVDKLLETSKLSSSLSGKDIPCDVCCDDKRKKGGEKRRRAIVYCIECRVNMCDVCSGHHQKFKYPVAHTLADLEKQLQAEELLLKFQENRCDEHVDKPMEIYCTDCKMAVCTVCYITSHQSHEISPANQVTEELREKMKLESDGIEKQMEECRTLLEELSEDEKKFLTNVDETKKRLLPRQGKLRTSSKITNRNFLAS